MKNTALIIVDMLKDNVYTSSHSNVGGFARELIPGIKRLLAHARENGMPVIFANDAFLPDDFLFRESGMKAHCIMGTEGAKVIDEFGPEETDVILEKRRFSAFLGTDLDSRLREMGVDTVAVAGISTPVCVLTTAIDGLAHDYKVIMVEDCCAAPRREDHEAIVNVYRSCLRGPLFRIISMDEFISETG